MPAKSDVSVRSVPAARWVLVDAATAGVAIVLLHFGLLAANQWLILDQLRAQTPPHLHQLLADEFLMSGSRALAVEAIALAAAAFVVLQLRTGSPGHDARLARALLFSYTPIVLHSAGVAAALLGGWMLDLWILSDANAAAADVAATIREALPVILEPFAIARLVVNALAALTLAVLLWRSAISAWRSIAAAIIFIGMLTAARIA